jgi:hypothetical protein
MKGEFNDFGGFGSDTTTSSSSSGRSSRDLTALPEWAADYILSAIQADGSEFNMSLFASDAPEVPEGAREQFDVPDSVGTVSIEEFYPQDFDCGGVGGTLSVTYEQLANSVEAGYLSQEELDSMDIEPGESVSWKYEEAESTPQSIMRDVLVGYYGDEIVSRFGDDKTVRVGAPKKSHSRIEAAHQRFTIVRFLLSDSKNAAYNRVSAAHSVGEITTSEYEEWCTDNGFEDKL